MAVTHPVLSREDFDALQAECGWTAPLEHLDGQAVVTPPADFPHNVAQARCVNVIYDWQRSTGDRGVIATEAFVLIDGATLAPDAAYWSEDRKPAVVPGRVVEVPDLVVEIASPSTRANDLGPKRRAYLRAGVREQWLVDPIARTALVVGVRGGERTVPAGGRLRSEVLAGFATALEALLG